MDVALIVDASSGRHGRRPALGLLTGGYREEELRAAGALDVYPNPEELGTVLPRWIRSLDGAPDARVAE
jgi:hypothetical protein